MKNYHHGVHTEYDFKVHMVWIAKYRKHVFIGEVAVRVRGMIRLKLQSMNSLLSQARSIKTTRTYSWATTPVNISPLLSQ